MNPELASLILLALRIFENSKKPIVGADGVTIAENIREYRKLKAADEIFQEHFGMSKEELDARLESLGVK